MRTHVIAGGAQRRLRPDALRRRSEDEEDLTGLHEEIIRVSPGYAAAAATAGGAVTFLCEEMVMASMSM